MRRELGTTTAAMAGAGIVLLAALAYVAAADAYGVVVPPCPDEAEFLIASASIRDGDAYRSHAIDALRFTRPPVYPLMLAVTGDRAWLVNAALVALVALSAGMVARNAGFGRGVVLAAGAVSGLSMLPLVPHVMSDIAGAAGIAGALWAISERRNGWATMLLVAAALTRPALVPVAIVVALVAWWRKPVMTGALAAIAYVAITWSVYAWSEGGRFAYSDWTIGHYIASVHGVSARVDGDPVGNRAAERDAYYAGMYDAARIGRDSLDAYNMRYASLAWEHPVVVATGVATSAVYSLLSTTMPWERDFPGVIPRAVVRWLCVAGVVAFVIGVLATRGMPMWGVLVAVWLVALAELAAGVGYLAGSRIMYPAAIATGVFTVAGITAIMRRVRNA